MVKKVEYDWPEESSAFEKSYIVRISPEERYMILAERSFDPAAREAQLATPTLPLVRRVATSVFCQFWKSENYDLAEIFCKLR